MQGHDIGLMLLQHYFSVRMYGPAMFFLPELCYYLVVATVVKCFFFVCFFF